MDNRMNAVRVLLRAYYERLYERMEADRSPLLACIDVLLPAEIAKQGFGPMRPDQVEAYREACVAFIDERLEMYNPIGIQYTFDRAAGRRAAELEFQLNWYESRSEFDGLLVAARSVADEQDIVDANLSDVADRLIRQAGAFPDRSIIEAYNESPALQKLPDFLVASAIEELIGRSGSNES